jgi:hypothetical protein
MNVNEKPLQRLNYFNGQRLQASDFKLEQDYHIRVRRWLNRSLYTAGIADGLQVYAIDGAPRVRVMPGLAIDVFGREIILLEEKDVDVVGQHNTGAGCSGPYLTIRYQEDIIEQSTDNCVPCGRSSNKTAETGPARILADPVLELNDSLPDPGSGKVALACISLAAGCATIDFVDTSVRTYIGDASASKVKQYAMEGVRDIDAKNPARIYFHIRGRQPTSVTLYLRSEIFPLLHYSEMGNHTHSNGGTLSIPAHTHGPNPGSTAFASLPTPTVNSVKANVDADVWKGVLGVAAGAATAAIVVPNPVEGNFLAFTALLDVTAATAFIDDAINPDKGFMDLTLSPHFFHHAPGTSNNQRELRGQQAVNMQITMDAIQDHNHGIDPFPADGNPQVLTLSGTGSGVSAGVNDVHPNDYSARSAQNPLQYIASLHVAIDGHDVTEPLRKQVLNSRPSSENWTTLGSGNSTDALVVQGTGPIRVDYLPTVTLNEGEHYIDLNVVGAGNGGRIHFNLYVE